MSVCNSLVDLVSILYSCMLWKHMKSFKELRSKYWHLRWRVSFIRRRLKKTQTKVTVSYRVTPSFRVWFRVTLLCLILKSVSFWSLVFCFAASQTIVTIFYHLWWNKFSRTKLAITYVIQIRLPRVTKIHWSLVPTKRLHHPPSCTGEGKLSAACRHWKPFWITFMRVSTRLTLPQGVLKLDDIAICTTTIWY